MTIFLLWLLATVDSTFIGYREAAGRNALIDKRAYFQRAMIRGVLFGQVAVVIVGLVAAGILAATPQPARLFDTFEQVAARMLMVYVPYALIITITFIIRAIPSVDIRSITSVLVFGPFTLIRPLVVLAGAIWGILAAPTAPVLLLVVLIISLMLGMEYALSRLRARGSIRVLPMA
jgi:L-asparagine transporter-like permease